MKMTRQSIFFLGLFTLAALLLLSALLISSPKEARERPDENEAVFCTQEAKLCPDGSYVGRTAPKCDFAPCPQNNDEQSWNTLHDTSQGVQFSYPETLSTTFIATHEWPPKITVLTGNFSCVEGEYPGNALPIQREQRTLQDNEYCIDTQVGAAAGSTYIQYSYATVKDEKIVTLSFTLRTPNCENYDVLTRGNCAAEQEAFELDALVERMMQSVRFE